MHLVSNFKMINQFLTKQNYLKISIYPVHLFLIKPTWTDLFKSKKKWIVTFLVDKEAVIHFCNKNLAFFQETI